MSDLPLHPRPDGSPTDPTAAADRPTATDSAVIVSTGHGPDVCTIFPLDVGEEELLTTWISAEEGSFVPLAEMR